MSDAIESVYEFLREVLPAFFVLVFGVAWTTVEAFTNIIVSGYHIPLTAIWVFVGLVALMLAIRAFHNQRMRAESEVHIQTKDGVLKIVAGGSSDSATLRERNRFLSTTRESRRERMRIAMLDMTHQHGHIDINGLMEAFEIGKSFNEENCWECGEPRFLNNRVDS